MTYEDFEQYQRDEEERRRREGKHLDDQKIDATIDEDNK